MTTLSEYDSLDALGLAELVRRRQASPLELVDAAIERIERRNALCNAVVHKMYERARHAARGPLGDGPFAGVPFLVKDLMAAYAGEPLTSGSRFTRSFVPDRNSELVERFLRAGLIVVAKTNTPELGLLPFTEPVLFGPSYNPWDRSRTPGGSSGGSAAAVAARMVPMASGGDGGGSIRIPASCCGLFGLKPTRGRNPTGPLEGEAWEGFAVEHVITRSVRDSAAILDATAGPDIGAPYFTPPPARPFREEARTPPGRLRIAVTRAAVLGKEVHADCSAALDDAARLLRELGHEIVEATPPIDARRFGRAMVTMLAGQTAAEVRDAEVQVGRKATHRDFEPGTWITRVIGETLSAGEYQSAVRTLQRDARALMVWTQPFDAWLTPTLGAPPPHIGELSPKGLIAIGERVLGRLELGRLATARPLIDSVADKIFSFVSFTPLANATGQPSMSVPLHWSGGGLPIGVMFTGRYGDEATLLRLAAQLEEARPWSARIPRGLR